MAEDTNLPEKPPLRNICVLLFVNWFLCRWVRLSRIIITQRFRQTEVKYLHLISRVGQRFLGFLGGMRWAYGRSCRTAQRDSKSEATPPDGLAWKTKWKKEMRRKHGPRQINSTTPELWPVWPHTESICYDTSTAQFLKSPCPGSKISIEKTKSFLYMLKHLIIDF